MREQAERDQACWKCGELDHSDDDDDLMLCDGDDCMNASHVKCNDPPLPGVPKGEVSFWRVMCFTSTRSLLLQLKLQYFVAPFTPDLKYETHS